MLPFPPQVHPPLSLMELRLETSCELVAFEFCSQSTEYISLTYNSFL